MRRAVIQGDVKATQSVSRRRTTTISSALSCRSRKKSKILPTPRIRSPAPNANKIPVLAAPVNRIPRSNARSTSETAKRTDESNKPSTTPTFAPSGTRSRAPARNGGRISSSPIARASSTARLGPKKTTGFIPNFRSIPTDSPRSGFDELLKLTGRVHTDDNRGHLRLRQNPRERQLLNQRTLWRLAPNPLQRPSMPNGSRRKALLRILPPSGRRSTQSRRYQKTEAVTFAQFMRFLPGFGPRQKRILHLNTFKSARLTRFFMNQCLHHPPQRDIRNRDLPDPSRFNQVPEGFQSIFSWQKTLAPLADQQVEILDAKSLQRTFTRLPKLIAKRFLLTPARTVQRKART